MTFDEVDDQLTLPRYNSLQRFWSKHPPTAILMAHYVGWKVPTSGKVNVSESMDDESMEELAKIFGMPVRPSKGGSK